MVKINSFYKISVIVFILACLASITLPLLTGRVQANHLQAPRLEWGPGGTNIIRAIFPGSNTAAVFVFNTESGVYEESSSPGGFGVGQSPIGNDGGISEIRGINPPPNTTDTAPQGTLVVIACDSPDPRVPATCEDHQTFNGLQVGQSTIQADDTTPCDPADPECESDPAARPNCQSTVGGELSWIACPVSSLLINILDALAEWLSNLLQVKPLTTGDAAYSVWSSMRNIALGLFVIAVLIVIFGQSIGIDAYTVKRLAPRLGVAAIGIMLSFFIVSIMIDLFNVFGKGMYSLMLGALNGQGITVTLESSLAEWAALLGAIATGAFIAIKGSGLFYLFSALLIPIVLAFFAGFVVILVRQVILVLLIVISPIAIAATVLPNTNQWFKRWWGLFSSLLMMYPIIMILLASGSIFATIVTSDDGGGTITESNFINQLIALAALAFTVGLIPFTLRASSSLLGKIASVVNNPNKGPIDRWRKAADERATTRKDMSRQNRLKELGQLQKDETEKGVRRPFRKSWLALTSGSFGYGSQNSEFGKTQRAEAIAGARSTQDRQVIAEEKARRETAQFADFALQKELSEYDARGERDKASAMLVERAKNIDTVEGQAAGRAIITQRLEPELREVFDHVARNGTAAQRTALGQFKQENFGNIDSFAAHISRGEFTDTGYNFAGSALGSFDAETLKTQKGIEFAIGQAVADGGDNGKKFIDQLMTTYLNTAPHQRSPEITKILERVAAGYYQTSVPKLDSSGQKQFDGNKLVKDTLHTSIPAAVRPDEKLVERFEQEILDRKIEAPTPPKNSLAVSPAELKERLTVAPTSTGVSAVSQAQAAGVSSLPTATMDRSSIPPVTRAVERAPAPQPQTLTRSRIQTMTSGQIREYVQQQGGYQEMALSDLQLIAEGNPATEEVQQAINTLAAKGVPLKPTTSTQVTPTFEQRKQRVIETAGQGFSRADEITQDNIHEFEDSFNIPRADSAPSSGTRRGVLGSDAKNELPNTNVEPFEPSKFRGEDDSGNEDNENEADS